jgi:Fe-Mn family superoxide dismutase
MGEPSKSITVATLIKRFETPGGPVVLDVRRATVFEDAVDMIQGAVWSDPAAIEDWAGALSAEADYVVYCVHGHEVSQNTAAALRANGNRARYLEGGIDAFRAAYGRMMGRGSNAK